MCLFSGLKDNKTLKGRITILPPYITIQYRDSEYHDFSVQSNIVKGGLYFLAVWRSELVAGMTQLILIYALLGSAVRDVIPRHNARGTEGKATIGHFTDHAPVYMCRLAPMHEYHLV